MFELFDDLEFGGPTDEVATLILTVDEDASLISDARSNKPGSGITCTQAPDCETVANPSPPPFMPYAYNGDPTDPPDSYTYSYDEFARPPYDEDAFLKSLKGHPPVKTNAAGFSNRVCCTGTTGDWARQVHKSIKETPDKVMFRFCPACIGRTVTFYHTIKLPASMSYSSRGYQVPPMTKGSGLGKIPLFVPFSTIDRREIRGRAAILHPPPDSDTGSSSDFSAQLPACQMISDTTTLRLSGAVVVENNIGGVGPNFADPQHMRVQGVGSLNGQGIDLIVRNLTRYTPFGASENYFPSVSGEFLEIPIDSLTPGASTSVRMQFSYVKTGTLEEIVLPQTRLEAYDFDYSVNNGVTSTEWLQIERTKRIQTVVAPNAYIAQSDETGSDRFTATQEGYFSDNPEGNDPSWLTEQQARKAVAISIKGQSSVTVQMGIDVSSNPNGIDNSARYIFFHFGAGALWPLCLEGGLSLTVQYKPNPYSLRSDKCVDIYSEPAYDFSEGEGSYQMQVAFPPREAEEVSAEMAITPHPSHRLSSVAYQLPGQLSDSRRQLQGSNKRFVFQHTLDTAWLVPDGAVQPTEYNLKTNAKLVEQLAIANPTKSGGRPLVGQVASVLEQFAGLVGTAGNLEVSLHRGMAEDGAELPAAIETVATREEGYFAFESPPLDLGMYTLRVTPRAGTCDGLLLAGNTFNMAFDAEGPSLEIVALSDCDGGNAVTDMPAMVVLSWDNSARIAMSLRSVFGTGEGASGDADIGDSDARDVASGEADLFFRRQLQPSPSTRGKCDVWPGLPSCGRSKYIRGGRSSNAIEVAGWASGQSYSYFATYSQRSCNGFGLPSISGIPGGDDAGVNCNGDCVTGDGYCYSTNDGQYCANCKLWDADPAKGEVLCTEVGRPQSGVLPGTQSWRRRATGCSKSKWSATGQVAQDFSLLHAGGRHLYSRPTVRIISGQEVAASLQLPSYGELEESAASWLFCIATSENGPLLLLGSRTALSEQELADAVDGTSQPCETLVDMRPKWTCDSGYILPGKSKKTKKRALTASVDVTEGSGRHQVASALESADALIPPLLRSSPSPGRRLQNTGYNFKTRNVGGDQRIFACDPTAEGEDDDQSIAYLE